VTTGEKGWAGEAGPVFEEGRGGGCGTRDGNDGHGLLLTAIPGAEGVETGPRQVTRKPDGRLDRQACDKGFEPIANSMTESRGGGKGICLFGLVNVCGERLAYRLQEPRWEEGWVHSSRG